jgi:uncharacterized protein YsxB (DUF464 family)
MLETSLAQHLILMFREMHNRVITNNGRAFQEDEALLYQQTCRTLTINARVMELRLKQIAAQYERETQGEVEEKATK